MSKENKLYKEDKYDYVIFQLNALDPVKYSKDKIIQKRILL
jgi:hypothetical protein